jgi:hypothetical protein
MANTTCQGNLSKIPINLLRFISTTGECPEERKTRENLEDELGHQIISKSFYYGVFDTIDNFVNFYFGVPSSNKDQYTQLLSKIFVDVLVPWSGNQVINSRGNGLCAYNCLYMFLSMTRPDILELYDVNSKFAEFKQFVRDMAVNSLDEEIREVMIPLIDDISNPDLDPIFTSFVNFTGINILMININNNTFTFNKSKFTHKDFPTDHIVIIRNASHLMFLHSNKDYTHRQQLYQQIDSNTN